MTESKIKRLKIKDVVSVKSYIWLKVWKENRLSMPYQVAPENSFYQNKAHRNYLSKWLEAAICAVITGDGWFVKKVETTGRKIKNKYGKEIWIKSASDNKKGEPDIQAIINGRVVYFEVKVKKDRMSKDQKEFKDRMNAMGVDVHEVKTMDDFLDIYEGLAECVWSDFVWES